MPVGRKRALRGTGFLGLTLCFKGGLDGLGPGWAWVAMSWAQEDHGRAQSGPDSGCGREGSCRAPAQVCAELSPTLAAMTSHGSGSQ